MIGKLRTATTRTLALRAAGTLAAGAVLAGTGAAAAQAAVPTPGKDVPTGVVSAADAAQQRAADAKPNSTAPAAPKQAAPKQAAHAPTAQDAVRLAESQVGQREQGAGATKFSKWYMATDRAKETVKRDGGSLGSYKNASWCSMFVSWVGNKLQFSDQMGEDAWTVQHAKWFEDNGRWGHTPKPGAVVFFSWDGGKSADDIEHVGMVVKDNHDGTIKTVEGNTGNAVKIKTRPVDSVVGFGYPKYAK
ncbi:CHAP domain protein [Actinomadura rubteroloni]|uniref:CHAP domain protein n=1 Tax=Actinomadura rubteroloni TaxID=1926885 RepID=A0A2P4UPW3_9ACTN|nr:CHAP domain-containing protein [Actinomadura rubteroloni]POM27059.1 CHAP domain protein [Actinomadura rubteroloni]